MQRSHRKTIRQLLGDLVERKIHLPDAKKDVIDKLNKSNLECNEENYIETKYIKLCLKKLETEIEILIHEENTKGTLQHLTQELRASHSFSDLPNQIKSSEYSELIANALKIRPQNENDVLFSLRSFVTCTIIRLSPQLNTQSNDQTEHLETLIAFLSHYKTQFIRHLSVDLICDGNFDKFDYDEKWMEIDKWPVAIAINRQHDDLIGKLKATKIPDSIKSEIKPKLEAHFFNEPSISVRKDGEKQVLVVVSRKILTLSKCLEKIQAHLSQHPLVEEVELNAIHIYFDESLDNSIWHGKNLLILSQTIAFPLKSIVVDVSGIDGASGGKGETLKGLNAGEDGKNGQNGSPGESGGNVTFIADAFENLEHLTIFSNGGNGGNGQSGGDGRNGLDGISGSEISLETLKSDYPTSVFLTKNKRQMETTIARIMQASPKIEIQDLNGFEKDGKMWEKGFFPRRHFYLKGILRNGIRFEYCFSQWGRGRCAYLLFQGAKGSINYGGVGGLGGRPGEGGYPGSIQLYSPGGQELSQSSVTMRMEKGTDGEPGKDGRSGSNGKPGKDGKDVGYLDYYTWKKPVYFSAKHFKIISKKESYNFPYDYGVWCSKYGDYRTIVECSQELAQGQVTAPREQHSVLSTAAVQATRKNDIDVQKAFEKVQSVLSSSSINSTEAQLNMAEILGDLMKGKNAEKKLTKTSFQRTAAKLSTVKPTPEWRKPSFRPTKSGFKIKLKMTTGQKPTFKKIWRTLSQPEKAKMGLGLCAKTRNSHLSMDDSPPEDYNSLEKKERKEKLEKVGDHIPCLIQDYPQLIQNCLKSFIDDVKGSDKSTKVVAEKCSHLMILCEKLNQGEDTLEDLDEETLIDCFREYLGYIRKTEMTLVSSDLALLETIDKNFYQMNSDILNKLKQNYNSTTQTETYDELQLNLNSFLEACRGRKSERKWTNLELQIISESVSKPAKSDENVESSIHFALETYGNARETYSPYRLTILGIIASHPAQDWPSQICQVAIEMYFGKLIKPDYTPTLDKLPAQLCVKIAAFLKEGTQFSSRDEDKFDTFLQKIVSYEPKSGWDYTLLDNLPTCSLWCHQLTKMQVESKLDELTNEVWDNKTNNKMEAFYYLHNLFESQPTKIKNFMKGYELKSRNESRITTILSNFHSGFWDLGEECIEILQSSECIEAWYGLQSEKKSRKAPRKLGELIDVIKSDPEENTITTHQKALMDNIKTWLENDAISTSGEGGSVPMPAWLEQFRRKLKEPQDGTSKDSLVVEALRKVDSVIKHELGYNLRNTQKIGILSALCCDDSTSSSASVTKLLSQVKTGEGKTCIVLSVAIIRGLFGKKTDVVTSNSILAQRDAQTHKKIYDQFELTVGEVTMSNPEERKREYLKMVVYGEVSNFQRDYLLDRFYNTNNRGNRGFADIGVIIDEVDSMFLDKGNSVLYLSHTPPDLNTLETIFLFVWNRVLEQVNTGCFNPSSLYAATMDAIFPRLTLPHLNEVTDDAKSLFKFLVQNDFISQNGRFRKFEVELKEQFSDLEVPLNLLIKRMTCQGPQLPVMKYLQDFVEFHLPTWIKSAYQATKMCDGVEYVVDFDRTNFEQKLEAKVIVLDMDTGVDMKDSQWTGGLHQFLQLKHGCRLSPLSMKAVFISNISFFKLYQNIFGLTGTLGTEVDRVFLQQTYDAKFLVIPTAAPRDFKEDVPIVCRTREAWFEEVSKEVENVLKGDRSTLIICETVRDVQHLHNYLSGLDSIAEYSLEMYRRDFEPFECALGSNGLSPGKVIIATNLAGRGTDINLTQELREKRGLHVIFSYLPNNKRVWWQGFGRASRCGDPGSGRLIFVAEKFVLESLLEKEEQQSSVSMAINYMLKNDEIEMSRVADICDYYDKIIKREEAVFERFHNLYKTFSEKLKPRMGILKSLVHRVRSKDKSNEMANLVPVPSGYSKQVQDILKDNLLDDWAYWLDKYSEQLFKEYKADTTNKTSFDLETPEFSAFSKYVEMGKVEDYIKKAIELVDEPAHLIKLGLFYTSQGKLEEGNEFFNKVTQNGEHFSSTIAKYYKLFGKLVNAKIRKHSKKVLDNELVQEIKLVVDELHQSKSTQMAISSAVSRNTIVGKQNLIITEGLKNQKREVAEVLHKFQESLHTFLNKEVTQAKLSEVCGNPLAAKMAFRELLEKELIRSPQISKKLIPNSCDEQIESALDSLVKKYPISREKLESSLISTRDNFDALKDSLRLPSTSAFWEKLNFSPHQILTFGVIREANSSVDQNIVFPADIANQLWKKSEHLWESGKHPSLVYICKKNTSLSTFNYKIIPGSRQELLQNPQFLAYKSRKLAYIEEIAVLDLSFIQNVKLNDYHEVSRDAFVLIEGIDEIKSEMIYKSLTDSKIINGENGELLSLEIKNWANELSKPLRSFKSSIVSSIIAKCIYKFQLLTLQASLQNLTDQYSGFPDSNNNNFPQLFSTLPKSLFKSFLADANDLNLISKCVVNSKKLDPNTGKTPSKKTIILEKKTFENICSCEGHPDNQIDSFWSELAALKTIKILSKQYSIEKTGCGNGQDSPAKITFKIIAASNSQKSMAIFPESEYSPTQKYLRDLITFEVQKEHILAKCKRWLNQFSSSCFLHHDKIQVDLVDIGVSLKTADCRYHQVLPSFYLSGIHYMISFQQGKYSTRMIISATIVLAMGVLQVAAGICMSNSELVKSGALDILYAGAAFWRGKFSWKSYGVAKAIQLALSVGLHMFPFVADMLDVATTVVSRAAAVSTPTAVEMGMDIIQSTVTSAVFSKGVSMGAQKVVDLLSKHISRVLARIVAYLQGDLVKVIQEHEMFDQALGRLSPLGKEKSGPVLMEYTQQTLNDKMQSECLAITLVHMASKLYKDGLKPAIEEQNMLGEYSEILATGLECFIGLATGIAESMKISELAKKSLERVSKLINKNIKGNKGEEEMRDEEVVKELRQAFTNVVLEKYAKAFQEHLVDNLLEKSVDRMMNNFEDIVESYKSGDGVGMEAENGADPEVDLDGGDAPSKEDGSSILGIPVDWEQLATQGLPFLEEYSTAESEPKMKEDEGRKNDTGENGLQATDVQVGTTTNGNGPNEVDASAAVNECRESRFNVYSENLKKRNSSEKGKVKVQASQADEPVLKEKLESVLNAFASPLKKGNDTRPLEESSGENK